MCSERDNAWVGAPERATLLETLAGFAAGLELSNLPAPVVGKAKLCVLDTVSACMTIGLTDGSAAALALLRPGEWQGGACRIFGLRDRADPEGAAFVNAVSAAATIRTDTHPTTASHPGMVVVPAVLACGEAAGIDGAAALAGVVAGYEFMIRLGLAVIMPELAATFRPTGLLGPGAAALGVARATKLAPMETVRAVALACHTAAGFNEWVHAGTNEHIYHGGFAARNAISAIRLAAAGAEAAASLLEGPSGLLTAFSAKDRASRVTEELGRRFLITETVHKPAPACIFAQSPAQAALDLVRTHALDLADIESVEIRTSLRAAGFPGCDNPGPFADAPSLQQSIQFSVAAVLSAGFLHERLWRLPVDPLISRLAGLCHVIVDRNAIGTEQPVCLKARLRDGRVVESRVPDFESMSESGVIDRFVRAAAPVLGAGQADQALNRIMRLEDEADLNDVTALLVPTK